jgi:plastocyanin
MKFFLIAVVILLTGFNARPGTIHGVVRAQGKDVGSGGASGGLYASRRFKFVERINYDELRDFVVHINGPIAGAKAPEGLAIIRQKDAAFIPHVLPIMVGTKVEWPNEDEVFHNVFSKSDAKSFDLDLYRKGEPPKVVLFDKPGEVDVFCSIHSRMSCVVLVLENPCFAVTDAGDHYVISNVPPGTYELTAWHERLPDKTVPVTIKGDEDVKVDITMGIENLPKY